ncbi:MAG: transketolase C-terminal domain-containing protein [Spirochaetota bacterium]|nr:transketolase C-terminal domain-containing protein [Spirochaetota bacterium]
MEQLIRMRDAYGESLVRLGKKHEQVVTLTADVCNSDRSILFEHEFPDRFFNVGIAEQSLVDTAVGLAYSGYIPFVNTFAVFLATRAIEMVRTHLCYGRANVKLMGAYAGLSDSFDGPTHHSLTDVAIMRCLPNMSVVVPGDPGRMDQVLEAVYQWDGPVFVRLNRNEVPVLFDSKTYNFRIGTSFQIRDGKDATIFTNGVMISRCIQAADQLESEGISTRLVEMHTVKPLDKEAVEKAAEETGALVTVEEHSIIGGLGGAVAETVTGFRPVPVVRVGVNDQFAETGPYEVLLDHYGLAVSDVVASVKKGIALKH